MAEIIKPDMTNLWASGGAVVAPSASKIEQGWTAEIPPHQYQNWWQYRTDSALGYLMQHGIPVWDATTEYFGGKSFVQYSGLIYVALVNNTNTTPDVSPTFWRQLPGGIASTSDAQALTNDLLSITPKKLADAFKGGNQSLLTAGYQKLPGGLILQWCTVSGSLGGTALVTFPITFPNVALHAMSFYIAGSDPGTSVPASIGGTLYGTLATNAVNVRFAPGYLTCRVLAWGY